MKKYLFLGIFLLGGYYVRAQCLVNSLVINTGYNPITGLAIPGGANGAVPVIDPRWKLTAVTPGVATAIAATPIPGLIEVVPGNNDDVILPVGLWAANPPGNPGGWISCVNSSGYYTDGTGAPIYNMTLGRTFRLCSDDTIKFDCYVANDNYISGTNIDGIAMLFSQPPSILASNFSMFTHFSQNVFLTAGLHVFNVIVIDSNVSSPGMNPTGMNLYGTFSSATGTNSLVSESDPACAGFACAPLSPVCDSLGLIDTIGVCVGDTVTLPAILSGSDSLLSVVWSPVTGLSSTTILNPVLTASTSGWYNITVQSISNVNLVVNGDFEAGNTGFSSSYTYAAPPSTVLVEGNYSVYTNPHGVHLGFTIMGDHTTGAGNMLIINGGAVASDVWCETIPVTPNTDYDFSAWIANCSSVTVPPNVPIMQFKINGVLIGTPTTISSIPGVWVNFFNVWNSGPSTTAAICIYDANTTASGNDFALDDISFRQVCTAKDSVYAKIVIPDTLYKNNDTTLCISSGPLTLTAPPGYTSWLWNTGSTASSITAPTSGTYWVNSFLACAMLSDTFHINYIPLPVVNLGSDTAFCIGNTITLSSIQPVGISSLWSNGTTGDSIIASVSGTYWLQLYNGCTVTDTIHVTISPHPAVDLGPDSTNCFGIPDTLQSIIPYVSPTYLWSDASIAPTYVATISGTYWLQVTDAGCSGADTINIGIKYDTFTLANKDTAICMGRFVQVSLVANPEATFQWLPTAGIAFSTESSPLIAPDTTAMYYVNIYMAGCPMLRDSFFLDVQPIPQVYIGGNRFVCEFDTIHVYGFVSPAWYTHYNYTWSPAASLDNTNTNIVVFTPGSNTDLILTVNTSAGCVGADSAQLIVRPGNFALLDTNFTICPHDSVQLTPTGGSTYHWSPGIYLSDSMIRDPWVHAITDQDYTAYVTDQFGCKDTVFTHVIVRPAAVIYLGDSVILYPGESYQLSPQTNCVSFAWFPPAGLDNPYFANPVATPLLSTRYIVHAQTEWGCKAVDSIDIYVDESNLIAIPNAFTPRGSVNNKLYLIKRGIANLNYFRIFDRWGVKLYESNNIDAGWDGTFNGKPQPFGVYVYQVEATANDGKVFHKQGNVTLIR